MHLSCTISHCPLPVSQPPKQSTTMWSTYVSAPSGPACCMEISTSITSCVPSSKTHCYYRWKSSFLYCCSTCLGRHSKRVVSCMPIRRFRFLFLPLKQNDLINGNTVSHFLFVVLCDSAIIAWKRNTRRKL